jgi:cytochrome c peroxidase
MKFKCSTQIARCLTTLLATASLVVCAVALAHQDETIIRLPDTKSGGYADVELTAKGRQEPITAIPKSILLDPAKVVLGDRLFHDSVLSGGRKKTCNDCHNLDKGGADDLKRSISADNKTGLRNTPTVFNIGLAAVFNLDGRFQSLAELIDSAIIDPAKMDGNWATSIELISRDPRYKDAFKRTYGTVSQTNIVDTIEHYLRSLITPYSRFDKFLEGETDALSRDEQEGYRLFKEYGCASCHNGVLLGGNSYQRIDVFKDLFDEHSEINSEDLGRFLFTGQDFDHTLAFAVEEMAEHQVGIELTPDEIELLVKFLNTLTGTYKGEMLQ